MPGWTHSALDNAEADGAEAQTREELDCDGRWGTTAARRGTSVKIRQNSAHFEERGHVSLEVESFSTTSRSKKTL